MRRILLAAATLAVFATAPAQAVEVRVCDGLLRTLPLNDERGLNSALLQSYAVVNNEEAPVTLTSIHFQLKASGDSLNTIRLRADEIAHALRQLRFAPS